MKLQMRIDYTPLKSRIWKLYEKRIAKAQAEYDRTTARQLAIFSKAAERAENLLGMGRRRIQNLMDKKRNHK